MANESFRVLRRPSLSRAHVTDFHSCIRKRAGPPLIRLSVCQCSVRTSGLQCGGGGGRGIVEIYNCSLVRQKWSHEIGQIAFLVNGSQEWRSQAENTDGMERPKLLVHIELLPHVAPPILDVG